MTIDRLKTGVDTISMTGPRVRINKGIFKMQKELNENLKPKRSYYAKKMSNMFRDGVEATLKIIEEKIPLSSQFNESHLKFGRTMKYSRIWVKWLAVMSVVQERMSIEESKKFIDFRKNKIRNYSETSFTYDDLHNLLKPFAGRNRIVISGVERQFDAAHDVLRKSIVWE